MFQLLGRLFPYQKIRHANAAIRLLIVSDTFFFAGAALVDLVFSVFVITNISGANVEHLGIGHALFMLGILLTEPLLSKIYDSKGAPFVFYGFILGNFLKAIYKVLFILIGTVPQFYSVMLFAGLVHAIEYPAFSKLFTRFIDKGLEASEWSYKDTLVSLGKLVTFFVSGYIALHFGYKFLFTLSAFIMLVSGVALPLIYRKEFIK